MSRMRVEWERWPKMADGTQDDPISGRIDVESMQEAFELSERLKKKHGTDLQGIWLIRTDTLCGLCS